MGSSGRPVAQSIIVRIPTNVAGMVSGLLRSACSIYTLQSVFELQQGKVRHLATYNQPRCYYIPAFPSENSLNMFIQKFILMTLYQTPGKEDLGKQAKSILRRRTYPPLVEQ